ncbi:hypothetical protein LAZ67_8001059 [Cordylochernes scorpioides]|uniref:Uncharacterized protein n=1 Tax=Cordylochernes scorpioides TaxID=51811 RepID=A0ABY6KPW2_9ARAC|nr:hypothetical protein LAZ67_8001059 [Cordylochernes scorpioides]
MADPSKRRRGNNVPSIIYPDIPLSIGPVPHNPEYPIPTPPKKHPSTTLQNTQKKSLKSVLLHNGNQIPLMPMTHTVQLKGDYTQVRNAMQYHKYNWEVVEDSKMIAFLMGIQVIRGSLGNHKADDYYVELVENLITCYGAMGCRMSLKIHMLDAHYNAFKDNMGAYSEEQGEGFHKDIAAFELRYNFPYTMNMMGT